MTANVVVVITEFLPPMPPEDTAPPTQPSSSSLIAGDPLSVPTQQFRYLFQNINGKLKTRTQHIYSFGCLTDTLLSVIGLAETNNHWSYSLTHLSPPLFSPHAGPTNAPTSCLAPSIPLYLSLLNNPSLLPSLFHPISLLALSRSNLSYVYVGVSFASLSNAFERQNFILASSACYIWSPNSKRLLGD